MILSALRLPRAIDLAVPDHETEGFGRRTVDDHLLPQDGLAALEEHDVVVMPLDDGLGDVFNVHFDGVPDLETGEGHVDTPKVLLKNVHGLRLSHRPILHGFLGNGNDPAVLLDDPGEEDVDRRIALMIGELPGREHLLPLIGQDLDQGMFPGCRAPVLLKDRSRILEDDQTVGVRVLLEPPGLTDLLEDRLDVRLLRLLLGEDRQDDGQREQTEYQSRT